MHVQVKVVVIDLPKDGVFRELNWSEVVLEEWVVDGREGVKLLESHHDLSTNAFVQLEFDHFVRRPALLSDNVGWASYPVIVKGTLIKGQIALELSVEVQYSSTCPCSAALARQLIQEQFKKDFGAAGDVSIEAVNDWLGTFESKRMENISMGSG